MKKILSGFRFGMFLQFSIGPVFLYVVNLAGTSGFSHAESAVLGVTLADGIYIFLSALGVAALLENPRIQTVFKIFGFLVLSFFSFTMIFHAVSVWGRPLSASPAGPSVFPFFSGLFLTLSSPLTILFWAGVFSVKVSESQFSRLDLACFSLGCLSATLVFLSFFAWVFSAVSPAIPPVIINGLNLAVGILIFGFAVRLLLKKRVRVS